VDLQQAVANQERARDAGLDRFLVLAAHDESIDDRVDHAGGDRGADVVRALGCVRLALVGLDVVGDVERLAVDDQAAAPFLSDLGENEVEILAVDLEDRRAKLDLRAFGKGEDRFEDLVRRPARRRLAGARAVRLADRRKEQVQIAGDVGHCADRRSRVAADGFLFDRDHR
jgi:hypothetical protein